MCADNERYMTLRDEGQIDLEILYDDYISPQKVLFDEEVSFKKCPKCGRCGAMPVEFDEFGDYCTCPNCYEQIYVGE